jgi:hypothetical protein
MKREREKGVGAIEEDRDQYTTWKIKIRTKSILTKTTCLGYVYNLSMLDKNNLMKSSIQLTKP